MSRIYVCFVWHMHQPCYKDLVSGEYRLPWTRMHALKDYYGMVKVLEDFPGVKQTFNLVPSLMLQVEEYASGQAYDPFLKVALKPAEELTPAEIEFILRYFFQANPTHLIGRYKRYAELNEAWRASDRNLRRAMHVFNPQALRDLQVLSQLAWFEEEVLEKDAEVRGLVDKGRDYSLADQSLMGRKQTEILGMVLPVYREFAEKGQIEISATPFYHPILPLICDSNVAHEANPHVPLPQRFRFPEDARKHLERSAEYMEQKIGSRPKGLWPSEGSVSDEALTIAAEVGYKWAATDNGVLARTLGRHADPYTTYRPYCWRQSGHELKMIFRDHYLSDLVGFVYSRMTAEHAAGDFVQRIRDNCSGILRSGRDALVPVILDGENAWEHYWRNGRPFLRELYQRVQDDPTMEAVTVSEAFAKVEAEPLERIAAGSWISANFDVWIGFEEDNKAWELLLKARTALERVDPASVPEADYKLAWEELMIAEGSDWNWWYGPHHDSDNRTEFDQLYRDHLANMYRLLKLVPPTELSKPILRARATGVHSKPVAELSPVIDGQVTSYFEWMGAGTYSVDGRGGSMHGQRFLIRELFYGSNDEALFLRIDFVGSERVEGMEFRFTLNGKLLRVAMKENAAEILEDEGLKAKAHFKRSLEIAVPWASLSEDRVVKLETSIWQDGLPLDALPQDGALELSAEVAGEY
ncbi:MAG: glycoside hydrolase [Bryobacterales bacterium]|nr:glycoside hydrolase [Bryobacterales bacterium]